MNKDNIYYVVFFWMIKQLGLKGAELPVFAIIHSFSQGSMGEYTGSLTDIADLSGLTKQGAIKVLKKLVDKGYIVKEQNYTNGKKCNSYQVNFDVINQINTSSKQSLPEGLTQFTNSGKHSLPQSSKHSLPNNNIYNNIHNNENTSSLVSPKKIVEYWNEKLKDTAVKPVSKIMAQSKRYQSLNARYKEYGTEKMLEAIDNITKSDFLCGKNNRGWIITFDWFVKPNNFIKVLEGNYDNHQASSGSGRYEY